MNELKQPPFSKPVLYKWTYILKVLAPVLIFWGLQGLTQVLAMTGDVLMHIIQDGEGTGGASQWIAQDLIGISLTSLVLSSLLVIAVLAKMRIGISKSQWTLPSAKQLMAYIAALLGMMVWVDLLLSWLNLPDWNNALMYSLMQNPWGIMSVTLLGPIAEEFVFRAGVTDRLLTKVKPSAAVGLSALVFGLVHVNPPQVIGAGLLGALLAYSYYQTRSLWLPITLHIINNSMAVATTLYSDNQTESLRTLMGNDSGISSYVVLLIVAAVLGLGGLHVIRTADKK